MEREVKELTLLLLYLTSWEEKEKYLPQPLYHSWKGYPFEILNKLEEDGLITQGRRSKSVYLTDEGIRQAKELKKKYKIRE
ncbi:MAG: DUF6429 family protein [bacterium]